MSLGNVRRVGRLAVLLALAAGSLAACDGPDWPPPGGGGIAELRPAELSGEALGLNIQLACLRNRVDHFKNSPEGQYANANLPRAELLSTRIAREISGGLLADARGDLVVLESVTGELVPPAGEPGSDPASNKAESCAP